MVSPRVAQIINHGRAVESPRDTRILQELVDRRRQEQVVGREGPEQWMNPDAIPRTKCDASGPIPDNEGEYAANAIGAVATPDLVRAQDEIRVVLWRLAGSQTALELLAVVQNA